MSALGLPTTLQFVAPASAASALFHTDWSTDIGDGQDAVRDTDKTVPWTTWAQQYSQLNVESAAGLFSAGFTNCLGIRIQLAADRGIDAGFSNIIYTGISPQVGDSLYFRYYFRHDLADAEYDASWATSWAGNHPVENEDNQDANVLWKWDTRNDGEFSLYLVTKSTAAARNWVLPVRLNKATEYRIEYMVEILTSSTYNIHARVYNAAGALLYDDDDWSEGGDTLADTPTINGNEGSGTSMLDKFAYWKFGHNASATLYLAAPGGRLVSPAWRFGAAAFGKTDWLGAYSAGV